MTKPRREGLVLWLTGLSGAGKSTLCHAAEEELSRRGVSCEILDADDLRPQLSADLGFSREDRNENVRRIGALARQRADAGALVLVAAMSPFRSAREEVREHIGAHRFLEVYVNTPLRVCEERDAKGLYRKARNHQIGHFIGIDEPYEPPENPALELHTELDGRERSTARILELVIAELNFRAE